ncbi:MAG: aminotransferase class I/II-fold pyridoxal phosphate-dependent enzyme, partial [Steroidobacteraceae bacterium]|nr:aminotransferase class I/II-fold pyridoxal phosphate-dependent enzyme [Steroidobacteraceae bacterium]
MSDTLRPSDSLKNVRYEIRGRLARRAHEMERMGHEIISLNIGNPGLFGFRTPETMRLAMIENLRQSEAYCHQKGIFPAREAVVMQQQARGVHGVSAEEVFIGNGVSELIVMAMNALLDAGDEVLVPTLTFVATANAVSYIRAVPHFVECEAVSLGVDAGKLDAYLRENAQIVNDVCINRHTGAPIKALVAMHVFGHPCDIEALDDLARRWKLVLVEDAAESL